MSINQGILTARRPAVVKSFKLRAKPSKSRPLMMVPVWKAGLVAIALAAMAASYAYSVRPAPEVVKVPEPVKVYIDRPIYQPLKHAARYFGIQAQLAAAIPESALEPVHRHNH